MRAMKFLIISCLALILAGCLGSKSNLSTVSGVENSPTLSAYVAADHLNWSYSENGKVGTIIKTSGTLNWVERSSNGSTFNFVERMRNDEYVELFDSSRSMYLRLYANRGQFSTNGTSWNSWVTGQWNGDGTDAGSSQTCSGSRTLWNYSTAAGAAKFQKVGTAWQETTASGRVFNFVEHSINDVYKQIYDSSRGTYIRLYSDRALYSTDATTWNAIYNGSWADCNSGGSGSGGSGGSGSDTTGCRAIWTYTENNANGTLTKTGTTTNWVERSVYNYTFNFVEQSKDSNQIVLLDASRNLYIRLFATYGEWSTNGVQWSPWVKGTWNSCSGGTNPGENSPAPIAPTGITGTPGSNSITLNWPAVANATYYIIYRDGLPVGRTERLNYLDTALTTGRNYTYNLSACNATACSVLSTALTVTATSDNLFSVGGSVAGLSDATGSLILQNGSEQLTVVKTATSFVFPSKLPSGGVYNVSVSTQPTNKLCTLTRNTGTIAVSNIIDVSVTCLPKPEVYTLACELATFSPSSAKVNTSYLGTLTVPYYGGNGAAYAAGSAINSTGVTGLAATLKAGTLAANNANGNLIFDVTGLPTSTGAANFGTFTLNGASCALPTLPVVASLNISACIGKTISATPCASASEGINVAGQCWASTNQASVASTTTPSNVDTGWQGNYPTDAESTTPGTSLFQWSAAMKGATAERSQGACPTGWHVPSDCEVMYLESNLGLSSASLAVDNLYTRVISGDENISKLTSLNILTGGAWYNAYTEFAVNGYLWTSTAGSDATTAYHRRNVLSGYTLGRSTAPKANAMALRCLKD